MEELNQKRPAAKRPRQNGETPHRPRQGEGKSVTKRAPRPARQNAKGGDSPAERQNDRAPARRPRQASQPRLPGAQPAPRLPRRRQAAQFYEEPAVLMHIIPLGGLGEV